MGRAGWNPAPTRTLSTVAVTSFTLVCPAPRLMLRSVMLWKVPMLVGLIVLGIHIWTMDKEFLDVTKDLDYFVASVEFAVAQFNDNNPEENTYRLLAVGRAQKKVSPRAELYPLMKSPRLGLGCGWASQGLVRRVLDLQNTLQSRI